MIWKSKGITDQVEQFCTSLNKKLRNDDSHCIPSQGCDQYLQDDYDFIQEDSQVYGGNVKSDPNIKNDPDVENEVDLYDKYVRTDIIVDANSEENIAI